MTGPEKYSSVDVAKAFSNALERSVTAQTIPRHDWHNSLVSAGFTENTSLNMREMTAAVITGIVVPEFEDKTIKLHTRLQDYLSGQLGSNK